MKKFAVLAILACCLFCSASAQTPFSGYVEYYWNNNPVVGQKVYIKDPLASPSYFDSAVTNSSGQYTFTVPASVPFSDTLTISTIACGMEFSVTNYRFNTILICGGTTKNTFSGQINNPPCTTTTCRDAMVYLVYKHYDAALADTTLTIFDSIAATHSYFSKTYSVHPFSTFAPGDKMLLKVALQPTDPEYANYLPTYYDSSLQWSGATVLNPLTFSPPGYIHQIHMQKGVNPGGPGFIGGSVLLGANKASGAGDPLAKRVLILTKSDNTPVAYTHSNSSGKFSFSNLAYGTYKLFGDVLGKNNPPLTVTLSASNNQVNNVVFEENRKDFTGHLGALGVAGSNPLLAGITVYPNPVMDYIEVGGLAAIAGNKTVTLSAINGTVIARQEVLAGQSTHIATALLAPGIYILRVQTAEGSVQLKVMK